MKFMTSMIGVHLSSSFLNSYVLFNKIKQSKYFLTHMDALGRV